MKKILVASDHAGFALKEKIKSFLGRKGLEYKDLGVFSPDRCDYPIYASNVARLISERKYKQGILICNSGIGNSIVANRFPGVRAALCYNAKAARLSREHNDSNILVMGAGFVSYEQAKGILRLWLSARFQGGRHKRRLDQIKKIEKTIRR